MSDAGPVRPQKFLAIDYGHKRTGLAIGDDQMRMALPLDMWAGITTVQLVARVKELARQERISRIVMGYPYNMDGSVGPQAKLVDGIIAQLEAATGLPVTRMDERLTSAEAEGRLAGHFTRLQKRQRVDALAAAAILQDYLGTLPAQARAEGAE